MLELKRLSVCLRLVRAVLFGEPPDQLEPVSLGAWQDPVFVRALGPGGQAGDREPGHSAP